MYIYSKQKYVYIYIYSLSAFPYWLFPISCLLFSYFVMDCYFSQAPGQQEQHHSALSESLTSVHSRLQEASAAAAVAPEREASLRGNTESVRSSPESTLEDRMTWAKQGSGPGPQPP